MKTETKYWLLYTALPFILVFVGGFISIILAQFLAAILLHESFSFTETIMNILTLFK